MAFNGALFGGNQYVGFAPNPVGRKAVIPLHQLGEPECELFSSLQEFKNAYGEGTACAVVEVQGIYQPVTRNELTFQRVTRLTLTQGRGL